MQCQMVDLWSSIDCCKLPRLSWFFLYLALSVAFLPDSQFAVSALHTELLQTAQPITLLSSTFFSFEDLEYLEPLYTEFLFDWMLLQLLLLLEGSHNDRCSSCTISANSVFLLKVQTWLSRSSNSHCQLLLLHHPAIHCALHACPSTSWQDNWAEQALLPWPPSFLWRRVDLQWCCTSSTTSH